LRTVHAVVEFVRAMFAVAADVDEMVSALLRFAATRGGCLSMYS